MSSVGLSFGSATSGDGIDVSSTVAEIIANYQEVETPWKDQLTSLEDQDAVLSTLGTDISTLTTDIQNLTDTIGVFSEKSGSSSDTDVLDLTSASSSAVAGTYTVTVDSIAQTSSAASSAVGSSDTLSGSVTIQVGSGTQYTVNVGDSSTDSTLSGLAEAINDADIGVTASVVTDTDGSMLSVVSGTSGSSGTLTVSSSLTDTSASSGSEDVSFSVVQTGKDASLEVDGISLTSASNTITDAIPGVTFQLLSADSSESVQVVIVNDTSSVESAINTFVSDYNTLMDEITGQEKDDSSGNAEPLFGNPIIAELQDALQSAIISAPASGSVTSVYSLGITANSDGTLSLDTDTLDSILNSDFSDVVSFFQDSGSFGTSFSTTLDDLGSDHTYGLLSLTEKMNSSEESTLNDDVSTEESRISIMESSLTTELNSVNETLEAIPDELTYVDELYSAITGYNEKS